MGKGNKWTQEMDDYLISNFSRQNIPDLMEYYGKSYQAIMDRASRLGLKCGRFLTESEKKFIQENSKTMNGVQMAKLLGRSKSAIAKYMRSIDVKSVHYWSDDDLEYLEDAMGKVSVSQISRKLKRTESAVRTKAVKSGIGCFTDNTEYLSMAEVIRLLGKKSKSVYRYAENKKLKTIKKDKRRMTTEENLIKFMQEYPELWDATKCDKYYFGMYDWFQQKRKVDFDKMIQRRWGNGETTLQQTAVN